MTKYLLLIALTIITNSALGQSHYQDVVFLKNGSIIRGIIIEQIPGQTLKIETADKSIFVFQMNEVEKMTREPISNRTNAISDKLNLKKGYIGIIEIGDQVGIGEYGIGRAHLNIINGYQLNPYLFIGLGTGLRYYFDIDDLYLPIFANLKVNLSTSKVSPYFSAGIGSSLNLSNQKHRENKTGLIFNPTIGINFNVSSKSVMNIGFGYEMQRMEIGRYEPDYDYSGALCIGVGISF